MAARRFVLAVCVVIAVAMPGSLWGETSKPVSRQAALPKLPSTTPVFAVARAGGRVIGVGAYGAVVVVDAGVSEPGHAVQAPSPIDVTLTSIAVHPDGALIAAGHESTLMQSVDNGDSWTLLRTDPLAPPILELICLREGVCIAVGGNGLVLTSNDSGTSWNEQYLAVEDEDGLEFDPHLFAVVQLEGGRLIATGERGYVFSSVDVGQTWQVSATGYEGSLFSVSQIQDGSVVAFGMSGNVVRSVDHGQNWTHDEIELNDVVFASKNVDGKLVVSGAGGLFEEVSGGTGVPWRRRANYQVADFVPGINDQYFLGTSMGLRVIFRRAGS